MKKELIEELLLRFENARTEFEGAECWSARDLQEILGYAKWQNFQKTIDRAEDACSNSQTRNHRRRAGSTPNLATMELCYNRLEPMKRISPKVLAVAFLTTFLCSVVALSQEPTDPKQYSAPVNWTEYQIPSQKLSIPLPKVPVIRAGSDDCSETEVGVYSAYAGGAVYEFEWHAKSRTAIPAWCSTKSKFSKASLTKRIDELKAENWGYVGSETTVAGAQATLLRSTSTTGPMKTRWLIWQKDRWLELGITRRKDTVINEAKYLGGLKLSSSSGTRCRSRSRINPWRC